MKLTNFRDISPPARGMTAGFQWEFTCDSCGDSWKSPYKPFRVGQATGILRRVGVIFGEFYKVGAITDLLGKVDRATGTAAATSSDSKPKQAALEEAIVLAQQRYHRCRECEATVCDNCWNPSTETCVKCERPGGARSSQGASTGATACPNCQTASQGGRFCHECGFDMASTHKSCPGCGATMGREARFCTDCGHGF